MTLPSLIAITLLQWLIVQTSGAKPVVKVSLGKINGALCSGGDSDVARFRGIPYAKPPVGSLRWAAPVKYDSKYPSAGLDATTPGPACRQGNKGKEDCLYLNVWAPANITGLRSKLPVRVFIHGGGYQDGKGTDDLYDGCKLVKDGNVVYVTMNYRLGILGFLALPDLRDKRANLTVGNWGLLDQRLALQWVQENIGAFGGDPTKVVLSGESAGAYSTLLHLVSPGSKGLFSAAASFSGSADAMAVDFLTDAYRKGNAISQALKCSRKSNTTDSGFISDVNCLRALNSDTIMSVQADLCVETIDYCVPTIDGVDIPEHPVKLMQEGHVNKVPVLLGVNENEGALEVLADTGSAKNIDLKRFFKVVTNLIPVAQSFLQRLQEQYNADDFYGGNWIVSAIHAITDGGYHCPSRRAAKFLAAYGLSMRYHVLRASQPNSGCSAIVTLDWYMSQTMVDFVGAQHTYDLPFTFLAPYRSPYNQCPFTANETQLASYLSGIISSIAATGSPLPPRASTLTSSLLKTTPTWPTWTNSSNPVMVIDTAGPKVYQAAELMLDAKCQLWDDILAADIAAGTSYHD